MFLHVARRGADVLRDLRSAQAVLSLLERLGQEGVLFVWRYFLKAR
jgi:hypothetical protein